MEVSEMNEVLGLNEHAWETWIAYRKKRKKPLPLASYDAAKKRLASFGEGQMDAVLTSIANGWQGIFPPGKKAPSMVRDEQKAQQRAQSEARALADLRTRAARIGFRDYIDGTDDLCGFRTLVERAESNLPRRASS
jgi:hypothetical protein